MQACLHARAELWNVMEAWPCSIFFVKYSGLVNCAFCNNNLFKVSKVMTTLALWTPIHLQIAALTAHYYFLYFLFFILAYTAQ